MKSGRKISLVILASAIFILLSNVSYAEEKDDLLASFIYNFVDYVKWQNKKDITICTYGYDRVSVNLERLGKEGPPLATHLSNISSISILTNVEINKYSSCDLIYVAQSEEKNILLLIEKIQNTSIITISSMDNFITMGGMMEFKVRRRKVQLKIGELALKKAGIVLSPVITMSIRPGTTD